MSLKKLFAVKYKWFLVQVFFMCIYYVALGVAAANLHYKGIFWFAFFTALVLFCLLLVGVVACFWFDKRNVEVAFFGDCAVVENDTRNSSNSFSSSLLVNTRVQETVVGNDNNSENVKDRIVPSSRLVNCSPMMSVSLITGNASDNGSFSFTGQPRLLSGRNFTPLEEKNIVAKKESAARQNCEIAGDGDVFVDSLTKNSCFTRHQSVRQQATADEEPRSITFELEEMSSLNHCGEENRLTTQGSFLFRNTQALGASPVNVSQNTFSALIASCIPSRIWGCVCCIVVCVSVVTLLIGSFWMSYKLGNLMIAIPVFFVPHLYLRSIHVLRLFNTGKYCFILDRTQLVLFHNVIYSVLFFLTVGTYTSAFVFFWYRHSDKRMSIDLSGDSLFFLCGVCFFSPVPVFCTIFFDDGFPHMSSYANVRKAAHGSSRPLSNGIEMKNTLNPLVASNEEGLARNNDGTNVETSVLSSIVLSQYPSFACQRAGSRSGRSIFHVASAFGEACNASIMSLPAVPRICSAHQPQTRSLTMLYIAFRDIDVSLPEPTANKDRLSGFVDGTPEIYGCYFQALVERARGLEKTHGPFALTAHGDSLCFVWGLQPLSKDPVLWAIKTADVFVSSFVPPRESEVRCALVAAVVHSPHAVVSIIGSGDMNNVHFLSKEHFVGVQLLERGFFLRWCEKNVQYKRKFTTSGIILDCRSSHLAASHILTRPVGIVPSISCVSLGADGPSSAPSRTEVKGHTVIYDFCSWLSGKQEEWHLAAQTREELSTNFQPAVEAAQAFFQGRLDAAIKVLEKAAVRGEDAVMQLLLDDLKRILPYDAVNLSN